VVEQSATVWILRLSRTPEDACVRCGVPRWCYALRRRELVLRGRVTARGA
jgi:hypothetical protein